MARIYITQIPTDGAEPAPGTRMPDFIFRATVDGETLVANRRGGSWFGDFRRAECAIRRAARIDPRIKIKWVPQYDSAYGEAAGEPCGYVGQVAS